MFVHNFEANVWDVTEEFLEEKVKTLMTQLRHNGEAFLDRYYYLASYSRWGSSRVQVSCPSSQNNSNTMFFSKIIHFLSSFLRMYDFLLLSICIYILILFSREVYVHCILLVMFR